MSDNTAEIAAADGTRLFVREWSTDSPRAALLIVHGLGEHSGRWEHVAEFFVGRGYSVTAFDLRGHGRSGGDRVDITTFDEYLSDLELMVDRTRKPGLPLVVYGHSMGGLIATAFAVGDRPQPDVYVLSAPALAAAAPLPLRVAARFLGKVAPRMRLPSSIKGEQLSRDESVGEAYFADELVETRATARFGAALLGEMDTIGDRLDRIHVPALVIHGTDDELVPPSASAPLAAVPGIERRLFAGLRHELHNEPEQAEVLDFVGGWLDKVLGS